MSYALAIGVGVAFMSFIFAYLSVNSKQGELQILFVSMSLLLMTIDFYLLSELAREGGYTSLANILEITFTGFFWVFFFVVSYLVIMFFYSVLKTSEKMTKVK